MSFAWSTVSIIGTISEWMPASSIRLNMPKSWHGTRTMASPPAGLDGAHAGECLCHVDRRVLGVDQHDVVAGQRIGLAYRGRAGKHPGARSLSPARRGA